jgi:adenosine deaminase/aminodeoxyfutalosine deaminase
MASISVWSIAANIVTVRSFCEDLAKAELHVHLEGSIEPHILRQLEPGLADDEIERRYRYADFLGFIESFKWVVGFLREPDDYALVTRALLERLARENVRYVEITLSAGVVLWRKQNFAAVYDAVTKEAAKHPVTTYWVLDAVRQFGIEPAWDVVRLAADRVGDRVVAFGLGGDESRGCASEFAPVLEFARSHGLALVPHAGETTNAESVWDALRCGARRIGHGIRAIQDPALLSALRSADVPLEVCISSNVATGAVASLQDHPVRRLFDAGVPIVLNTDDPAMFQTTLSREYEIAATQFGFSPSELEFLADRSFHYALKGDGRPVA